jgi:hypothetical protein
MLLLDEHCLRSSSAKVGSRTLGDLGFNSRFCVKCGLAELIDIEHPQRSWAARLTRYAKVLEDLRREMVHSHLIYLLLNPHAMLLDILHHRQIPSVLSL